MKTDLAAFCLFICFATGIMKGIPKTPHLPSESVEIEVNCPSCQGWGVMPMNVLAGQLFYGDWCCEHRKECSTCKQSSPCKEDKQKLEEIMAEAKEIGCEPVACPFCAGTGSCRKANQTMLTFW